VPATATNPTAALHHATITAHPTVPATATNPTATLHPAAITSRPTAPATAMTPTAAFQTNTNNASDDYSTAIPATATMNRRASSITTFDLASPVAPAHKATPQQDPPDHNTSKYEMPSPATVKQHATPDPRVYHTIPPSDPQVTITDQPAIPAMSLSHHDLSTFHWSKIENPDDASDPYLDPVNPVINNRHMMSEQVRMHDQYKTTTKRASIWRHFRKKQHHQHKIRVMKPSVPEPPNMMSYRTLYKEKGRQQRTTTSAPVSKTTTDLPSAMLLDCSPSQESNNIGTHCTLTTILTATKLRKSYLDQTSKLPVQPSHSYDYVMVLYNYKMNGHAPKLHILGNECSNELKAKILKRATAPPKPSLRPPVPELRVSIVTPPAPEQRVLAPAATTTDPAIPSTPAKQKDQSLARTANNELLYAHHIAALATTPPIAGQNACAVPDALKELDHMQPITGSPFETASNTAQGILNSKMRQKLSKSLDMRYLWIKDRIKQGQPNLIRAPGKSNLADHFTKHHPPRDHRQMRSKHIQETQYRARHPKESQCERVC
jgi:hypothetical protein